MENKRVCEIRILGDGLTCLVWDFTFIRDYYNIIMIELTPDSKVWVEEIQLWRKYDFGGTKVGIILVAARKRKEGDKYEWE